MRRCLEGGGGGGREGGSEGAREGGSEGGGGRGGGETNYIIQLVNTSGNSHLTGRAKCILNLPVGVSCAM